MGDEPLPENPRESTLRIEVSQLKRLLAEKTVELDFFKGALQKGSTPEERYQSREVSTTKIEELMPLQGSLSIERMCQLAGVRRPGFYRSLQERARTGRGTWKYARRLETFAGNLADKASSDVLRTKRVYDESS
jgi:hypothetical protein